MKKMKKKLFATLLTTCLLISSHLTVFAETTDITESSVDKTAQIELNIEINSTFTVGIPISAEIDPSTGTGTYDVSVMGDIDPRYKLVVTPVDTYTSTDGDATSDINFLLKDTTTVLNPKEDIVVNILPGQTEFICTDINLETPVTINNSLQITSGKLSAGTWEGTMKYSISLELLPVSP